MPFSTRIHTHFLSIITAGWPLFSNTRISTRPPFPSLLNLFKKNKKSWDEVIMYSSLLFLWGDALGFNILNRNNFFLSFKLCEKFILTYFKYTVWHWPSIQSLASQSKSVTLRNWLQRGGGKCKSEIRKLKLVCGFLKLMNLNFRRPLNQRAFEMPPKKVKIKTDDFLKLYSVFKLFPHSISRVMFWFCH